MDYRLPPSAPEAESALLGAILIDANETREVIETITPEHFYALDHRDVFLCIREMVSENAPVDLVTVVNRLKRKGTLEGVGGAEGISKLMDGVPSASNAAYYAEILNEKRHLRRVLEAAQDTIKDVWESTEAPLRVVQAAHSRFEAVVQDAEDRGDLRSTSGKALAQEVMADIDELLKLKGALPGISYGLDALDLATGGIHRGEIVTIGARPSVGKTAFACSVARAAAWDRRVPTLFITLESPVRALMRRIVSNHCNIPLTRFKSGEFLSSDVKAMTVALAGMKDIPLYFVGKGRSGRTVDDIRAIIRYHVREFGVQLVVIDYLTKIKTGGGGKFRREKLTYEIGDITDALHTEAERSNVGLMLLSQLKREAEIKKDRRQWEKKSKHAAHRDEENETGLPGLGDLGDSKAIEQDSDTVILLHRDRVVPVGPALAIVAKQRDGECKVCRLQYVGHHTRFTNLPPKGPPPPPPSAIPEDVMNGFPV